MGEPFWATVMLYVGGTPFSVSGLVEETVFAGKEFVKVRSLAGVPSLFSADHVVLITPKTKAEIEKQNEADNALESIVSGESFS